MDSFYEIVKSKSDNELLEMVYELEKWSSEMLRVVEEELSYRKILPRDINIRKQQLIELDDVKLMTGKKATTLGQVVGWLTVFGILGIFIGYNYAFSKTTSAYSGKEYFKYDEESRQNGKWLFYCAIILSAVAVLYRALREFTI